MTISDLIVNVRQISSYPELTAAAGGENILCQLGGLGGPYQAISSSVLVATALQSGSMGVGYTVPASAVPGQIFTGSVVLPATGEVFFNCYNAGGGVLNAWTSGPVGIFSPVGAQGGFLWQVATGQAGQPITGGTGIMQLTMAGALALPKGTLTVARDPSAALEVATMGYVGANTVASFMGRRGVVQLTQSDIYQTLGLDSPIASQQWVNGAITAGLQGMLTTCPFVNRWNGRTGSVNLMLSDITCVFFQSGQQPIAPTPPPTSNDNSIATTQWVTELLTSETGSNFATQAWVLANTVTSFNGRLGPVILALSDITNAGGAPLQSPQLLGVPTAPTQAVGNASSAIATTAFVWSAVQESTTGVVSFNGRTGVITLDTTDINNAGGALINSPALTGVPTAPTASTGTTTTQLATCAFVLNEVQAIGAGVTSFNTRSGNVVLELSDIEAAGGAPIASPAFSGNPTAPTPASPVAATTSIANTNWVVQYNALNTVASFNTRIGAVTLNANDITAAGGLANPNVALTGAPTAPTMVPGTSTTAIATCAFVQQAIQNLGGVTVSPTPPASPFTGQAWFNSTAGVQQLNIWTGSAWTPSTNLTAYAPLASPAFTGTPTVPTAPATTANNQAASTGFVAGNFVPLAGNVEITGNLAMGIPMPASIGGGGQIVGANVAGFPSIGWNIYYDGTNWRRLNTSAPWVANVLSTGALWFYSGGASTVGSVASVTPMFGCDGNGNITANGYIRTQMSTNFFGIQNVLNPVLAVVSMENYQGGNTLNVANGSASGAYAIQIVTYNNVNNSMIAFLWGGTLVGNISTNGAGVFYNTASDAQLKTGIRPITSADAGPVLDRIEPVWFQWSHDVPAEAQGDQPGFIAQDTQGIYPWAVREGHGAPGDDDYQAWAMDASKLIPVVVAEIKALRARVAALEARP